MFIYVCMYVCVGVCVYNCNYYYNTLPSEYCLTPSRVKDRNRKFFRQRRERLECFLRENFHI